MKGHVAVIQFPGINCEYETVRVLEAVGLNARIERWNAPSSAISEAAAVVIPGGFAYQDRIRAGVVAAKDRIMNDVFEAAHRGAPVLGICNGAQILVEAGVVTGFHDGEIDLALATNHMPDRSGYLCRWVRLAKGPGRCVFTEFMGGLEEDNGTLPIPIGHGEGRFVTASPETAARFEVGDGVALIYADGEGGRAERFPDNPNDSVFAIAGVCNPRGNVLALMPHPERASWMHQVPVGVGGVWARRRLAMGPGGAHAAGPGRGFFVSLKTALEA